jgi:hypothetical protein
MEITRRLRGGILRHWWYKTDNIRMNVTARRVRVTIVAVEKQQVLHIMSVFL